MIKVIRIEGFYEERWKRKFNKNQSFDLLALVDQDGWFEAIGMYQDRKLNEERYATGSLVQRRGIIMTQFTKDACSQDLNFIGFTDETSEHGYTVSGGWQEHEGIFDLVERGNAKIMITELEAREEEMEKIARRIEAWKLGTNPIMEASIQTARENRQEMIGEFEVYYNEYPGLTWDEVRARMHAERIEQEKDEPVFGPYAYPMGGKPSAWFEIWDEEL